jgi:Bacterial PH domain
MPAEGCPFESRPFVASAAPHLSSRFLGLCGAGAGAPMARKSRVLKRSSFGCVVHLRAASPKAQCNRAGHPMSYIEHSLGQSESLRYRAHFPWFYGGSGWALLFVSAILAAVAEWSGYGLLAVAFLLAGLSLLLVIMVPIWTTEIGVTDQRFIFKRGLLWRATQELQLRAIEEVNLEQGLRGRHKPAVDRRTAGAAQGTAGWDGRGNPARRRRRADPNPTPPRRTAIG